MDRVSKNFFFQRHSAEFSTFFSKFNEICTVFSTIFRSKQIYSLQFSTCSYYANFRRICISFSIIFKYLICSIMHFFTPTRQAYWNCYTFQFSRCLSEKNIKYYFSTIQLNFQWFFFSFPASLRQFALFFSGIQHFF